MAYLLEALRKQGLRPGGARGGWTRTVPLARALGQRIANGCDWPRWLRGSELRAAREEDAGADAVAVEHVRIARHRHEQAFVGIHDDAHVHLRVQHGRMRVDAGPANQALSAGTARAAAAIARTSGAVPAPAGHRCRSAPAAPAGSDCCARRCT